MHAENNVKSKRPREASIDPEANNPNKIVIMKYYLFFLVGLAHVSRIWGFNCHHHHQHEICICDNKLIGSSASSKLICMDPKTLYNSYVIEYAVKRRVRLECNDVVPFKRGMFNSYNITEIDTFHFINCPLPNMTFKELLQGMRILQLKFESRREYSLIKPRFFENLNELKTLSLVRNGFSVLPLNMFSNLSTLHALQLSGNKLQVMPENVFNPLGNLTTLDISRNIIKEMPESLFNKLTSLRNLYLFENELEQLPVGIFRGLEHLTALDISKNQLSEVPVELFSNLSKLEHLRLSGNRLKTLPEAVFQSVPRLKILNLVSNKDLSHLPERLLNGLDNLQGLLLDNCNLSNIPLFFFSNAFSLQNLKISNNKLTVLPETLFLTNSNLKELDLSFNKLNNLSPTIFEKQIALEKLNLENNRLEQLPLGTFNNLISLKILKISYNKLNWINKELFTNLQNLEHLDLSHNHINSIDWNAALGSLWNLKLLDFSYNNISMFPNLDWKTFLKLDILNFQYNQITNISVPILYSKFTRVLLRFNKITQVKVTNLKTYDNLLKYTPNYNSIEYLPRYPDTPSFFLSANPIHCDCNLLEFFDYLTLRSSVKHNAIFPNANLLMCAGPSSLAGKKLLDVARNELNCPIYRDCPEPCACHFRGYDKTVKVDCSNRNLDAIPEVLPPNTNVLYLQNNSISSFKNVNRSSSHIMNLKELYLDYNLLSAKTDWVLPPNLRFLSLKGNRLESLPQALVWFTRQNQGSLKLRLGKNEWRCDCSVLEFKYWLSVSRNIVTDSQDILCYNLMQNNGSRMATILDIPDEVLCPKNGLSHCIILITVSVVGILLFLFLSFTVVKKFIDDNKKIRNIYRVSQSVFKEDAKIKEKINSNYNVLTLEHYLIMMCNRQKAFHCILFILLLHLSDGFKCLRNYDPICKTVYCSTMLPKKRLYCTLEDDREHHNIVQTAYVITYEFHNYLKVECDKNTPYKLNMFTELDVPEIGDIIFIGCPLPNLRFSDILSGLKVRKLTFESRKSISQLNVSLFEELTSLNELNLSKNNISILPSDIFQNFINITSLYLSDNNLEILPENIFQSLTNLEKLELGSNQLLELPVGIFRNLWKLKRMYLYRNKLSTLTRDLFSGLKALESLNLYGNELIHLPEDVFSDLSTLKFLSLSENKLKNISNKLFRKNLALEKLNLNYNPTIKNLPGDLLAGLSKLRKFYISHCNLTNIPSLLFSKAPNLLEISMINNSLSSLPAEVFQGNVKLSDLNMSHNNLTSLPLGIFDKQTNLRTLLLNNNKIESLKPGIFANLINLQEINLESNLLKKVSDTLFENFPKLEILNLRNNQITFVAYDNPTKLKNIDLTHNKLKELPDINWLMAVNLKVLYLQNNQITNLTIPIIYSHSANIFLQNNQIETVKMDEVKEYKFSSKATSELNHSKDLPEEAHVFYLSDNPFQCDCNLLEFSDYLKQSFLNIDTIAKFSSTKDLTCNGPSHLAGKTIISVPRDAFTCVVENDCPGLCHCYFRASDKTLLVNCSGLHQDYLPPLLPEKATVLHFEKNNIKSLNVTSFEMYRNLTEIYLDENHISSIDNWNLPPKLEVISLRGNYLTGVSNNIIKQAENLQSLNLRLGKNPWKCDCHALEFKLWLTEHLQKVTDIEDIYCSEPMKLNGTLYNELLVQIPDTVLCPHNNWPQKIKLISISVISVVFAVLLFVASVFYYRNKRTFIAYMYIHLYSIFTCFFTEKELDEDKIFDAFISYSSSDREVSFSILKELENNEPYFKLCIHDRDWLVGNAISWNIVNSVQSSKKTILVISKDFLESVWFRIEFHTAYYQMLKDKVDRLIVVVRGELPPSGTLDKDFQFLLSTKTYLVWGEKWFWEKLRYAMPHHKSLSVPKNNTPFRNRPPSTILNTVNKQIESNIINENRNKKHNILPKRNKEVASNENNLQVLTIPMESSRRNGEVFICSRV
ncbi:protein toll-like [Limulus polyphemus]|uniref:Protein toll-like n=1 Tax=Limulus polyphemus TaxID=6850 RepID=A0ABM1RWG6_LIMPO|nr:protein toll-like [Limulus polyphemus]